MSYRAGTPWSPPALPSQANETAPRTAEEGGYSGSRRRSSARPWHASGDRWFIDEKYVKVSGRWVYLCRAIFTRALNTTPVTAVGVVTDKATGLARQVEEIARRAMRESE
ncbi:MAG: hypothetical protein ACRDQU_01485 [Pseudonocardiaceae bacterium]